MHLGVNVFRPLRLVTRCAVAAGMSLTLLGPFLVQADAPQLEATLTGVQVPGDPNPPSPNEGGSVRVTLGSDPGIICFALTVSHLPNIPAPVEGGMRLVIANHAFPRVIRTTLSTGCISGFSAAEISDLFARPQNYDVVVTDLNPDAAGCGDPVPCVLAEIKGQLGFAPNSRVAPSQVPNTAIASRTPTRSGDPDSVMFVGVLFIVASLAFCSGAWGRPAKLRPVSRACAALRP